MPDAVRIIAVIGKYTLDRDWITVPTRIRPVLASGNCVPRTRSADIY